MASQNGAYDNDIIAIHFGVSPLVAKEVVLDSLQVAEIFGNGISSDPVILSLAEKDANDNDKSSIIGYDRDRLMGLNSLQSFQYKFLVDLYREGAERDILEHIDPHTTSLMAALGKRLYFSKGSSLNIKITSSEDVAFFNACLLAAL